MGGGPAARSWIGWLGALSSVALVFIPPLAASRLLIVNAGGFTVAAGSLVGLCPGIALLWVLMPLAGYRRRRAWLLLVPIWGLGVAAEVGARLAHLSAAGPPPDTKQVSWIRATRTARNK